MDFWISAAKIAILHKSSYNTKVEKHEICTLNSSISFKNTPKCSLSKTLHAKHIKHMIHIPPVHGSSMHGATRVILCTFCSFVEVVEAAPANVVMPQYTQILSFTCCSFTQKVNRTRRTRLLEATHVIG